MKITYLVFDEIAQGRLRVATKDEWKHIMEQNRALPREQRRFFIEDCIHEGGELDCIFIESTKEDYDRWHREAQKKYRKKQHLDGVSVVSIDLEETEDSGMALIGKLGDNLDWEMRIQLQAMLGDEDTSEMDCDTLQEILDKYGDVEEDNVFSEYIECIRRLLARLVLDSYDVAAYVYQKRCVEKLSLEEIMATSRLSSDALKMFVKYFDSMHTK